MSITIPQFHPQYLISDNGNKTAVQLTIDEYSRLINFLEDIEDIIDLKKAKEELNAGKLDKIPSEEFWQKAIANESTI